MNHLVLEDTAMNIKQIIELLERLGPSANSDWGLYKEVQAAIAILEELDEPPHS